METFQDFLKSEEIMQLKNKYVDFDKFNTIIYICLKRKNQKKIFAMK